MRFLTITTFCLSLFLSGCLKSKAQEQGSFEQTPAGDHLSDLSSFESRCEELSQNTEYKYQLVSGLVTHAEQMFPAGDCFNAQECHEKRAEQDSTFFAILKYLTPDQEKSEKYYVFTKAEPVGSLKQKPLYMEKGNLYAFCARRNGAPSEQYAVQDVYTIDNTETILQITKETIIPASDR